MNDLSIFFQPLSSDLKSGLQGSQIGSKIDFHTENNFPDLANVNLAIIGVKESRNAIRNEGCAEAPDYVRTYLYKLYADLSTIKIVDLGNVEKGFEISDTYHAIASICTELIKKNILPIIIGGGQDLTYANYTAYQNLEQTVNLVSIDPTFDLGSINQSIDNSSYLGNIILHQPNYLFNYSNIGYQTYLTDPATIDLMGKLYFDCYRLGFFKHNMEEVEPIVRNADILSFDISAIRMSDAP
jgi:arginase family enzyme